MMPNDVPLALVKRDDISLVHSAQQGEREAFDELFRRHTETILRIATRITRSREDAEDIAQDTFLRAFRNIHRFEERSRFSTWLTRIAINEALINLRNPRRRLTTSIDDEAGEFRSSECTLPDGRPDPEQTFSGTEIRETLQRALDSLPYPYRVVFEMRDVAGISTLDTAEALELSIPGVKARLLRARHKLRKTLEPTLRPDRGYSGVLKNSPAQAEQISSR